jgi:hypothetical protein
LKLQMTEIYKKILCAAALGAMLLQSSCLADDWVDVQNMSPVPGENIPDAGVEYRRADRASQPKKDQAGSKVLLQGGVEHTRTLPPVEASLRPGSLFNANAFKATKPANKWYLLPDWIAGTWDIPGYTQYSIHDYRTGKTNDIWRTVSQYSTEQIGMQTDKLGQAWYFPCVPYVVRHYENDIYHEQVIEQKEVLEVGHNRVVINYLSMDIQVDRSTGRVVRTDRVETLRVFTPQHHNFIRCDASQKTFNEDGKPLTLERRVHFSTRISGFRPQARCNGESLRNMFREYLRENNLNHLIP